MSLREELQDQIDLLDRNGEFCDTFSDWQLKDILNKIDYNLAEYLLPKNIKEILVNKFNLMRSKYMSYLSLITLSDSISGTNSGDGLLLDDIMIRICGIPISEYFFGDYWLLNGKASEKIDNCIKFLSEKLTNDMYNIIGEDIFKFFDKKGFALSIDKNYCHSNFGDLYYSKPWHFGEHRFETLVVRIDKIDIIKARYDSGDHVLPFHVKRYKLDKIES